MVDVPGESMCSFVSGLGKDRVQRYYDFADILAMEFFVGRENIAAKAKRERANLEDAARRARYAFFEQLVKDGRVSRVAVAQTADDQAETVLAHILRGTGLAGLAGIHPQAGTVFRPLLGIRRAAVRAYLREKRQTWREDATNRDETRTRARIPASRILLTFGSTPRIWIVPVLGLTWLSAKSITPLWG